MLDTITLYPREAEILCAYLLDRPCADDVVVAYQEAVLAHQADLSPLQEQIWIKMLHHKSYLKLIDSGLAVTHPQSALRKRIFIMLCLSEAHTQYVDQFLPQTRGLLYLVKIGFRMGVAALYLIVGACVVKINKIQ
jgi:hypothetical protein